MPGEFDMQAGLAEISGDLFESNSGTGDSDGNDDIDLGGGDDGAGNSGDGNGVEKPGDVPPGDGDAPGDTGNPDDPGAAKGLKAPAEPAPIEDPKAARAAGVLPPESWTKDAQTKWIELPEWARKEVAKREEDMHRGIEGYRNDADFGKHFQQVLAPHAHLLQHFQVNPFQLADGLMKAHVQLVMGSPEQKTAMLRQIISDYGVSVQDLAAEEPYEDPQVKALRLENQRLQSQQQQAAVAASRATEQVLNSQIDAFEADPKNVYFKEVASDMVPFLKAGMPLQAAYERAIWANPVTRGKEQARLAAETSAKAAKDAADHAANARKATSANVRTSSKGGSATAPLGSMDDTMKEALAAIKSRE